MDKKKDILWRMYILYMLVLILGGAIIWKICKIQFIEGDYWRTKAELLSTDTFKVEPTRGNILAADNSYMSISVPMYDIRIDTKAGKLTDEEWNKNIDSLSICLAELFKNKSASEYKNYLNNGRDDKNQYLLVKRDITRRELEIIRTFPIFRLGRFDGGLIEVESYERVKPYGNLAARTIGREPGDESQGLGIEMAYNDYLKGEEGLRLMEKLSGGMWRPVNHNNTIEPIDGLDLVTTIQPQLQDVATSELEQQLLLHNASHGCVVVMEVSTGDVCAIANLKRGNDGNYYESYNYAIGEATDPGSTLKLATMIALLDDGYVKPNDYISTGNGTITYFNHTFHDSHHGGYGTITVQHAFEVSSNVAMIKMVMSNYKNNPQKFVDHLKKLHLHETLKTGIPGEATPVLRNEGDEGWSGLSLPEMAIGYEVNITPLQIVTMYNAIANDGRMVRPRFVKEIRDHNTVVKSFPTEVIEEAVCKKSTVDQCKKMMEGVVENGTAKNLSSSVYKIAGKTGTAVIINNGSYGANGKKSYRASFCGYFPADNPKYTCYVMVNAPSEDVYYGNVVAGPIFRAVADKIYASSFDINQAYYKTELANYKILAPNLKNGYSNDIKKVLDVLNVSHTSSDEVSFSKTTTAENKVRLSGISIQETIIPNVTGMGARDAIFILEKLGLAVVLQGKGTVKEQSLSPGSTVQPNQSITLVLN